MVLALLLGFGAAVRQASADSGRLPVGTIGHGTCGVMGESPLAPNHTVRNIMLTEIEGKFREIWPC